MLAVWIAIPLVLVAAVLARLCAGYPAPDREFKHLSRWSYSFLRTAGESMFPAGGELPPSSDEVDLVGYLDRWLGAIPKQQRLLMNLLFLLLEHAPLVFGPHLSRCSKLSDEARTAYFEKWDNSRFYFVRAMLVSLRMVLSFAFLDHPKVHEALGISDRDACKPIPSTHLSPEDRGDGQLFDLSDHGSEVTEECDVVVVGTGAGGAVAAKELAAAGLDVVVLEDGPFIRPEEVARDCGMGMSQILAEAGLRTMIGPTATPTMQGRCVGGSTLPNSAILFRIPEHVLTEWRDDFGIEGLTTDALAASYGRVEAATCKQQTKPSALGPKNLLFAKGAEALGIEAEAFHLAKEGCKGCGECLPSCQIGAKKSTDLSHVPDAVRAGARLYVNCRCDEVLAGEGGVRGVLGSFRDHDGKKVGRIRIRSRAAVLGAGVFGTPIILKRSGLGNSSGMVGRNLHTHPGAAVFGIFEDPVKPWIGSTQGYGAFIDERLKIEVLWSPMPVMAVRMPGFGHVLKENMALFKHLAIWDAVVRGTSTGRILSYSGNNPTVWYHQNQRDTDELIRGLRIVSDMFFAAGAQFLMPGIHGLPSKLGPDQVDLLKPGTIKPAQVVAAATHLFGTCRMSPDPRNSVVDSMGESHDVRNLFIVDSSVMPNGTQVNPHEPIMTLSDYFSQGIIERLRTS